MDAEARERLTAAGWAVGDANDFLDLSEAESAYVTIKVALARSLREGRGAREMTQAELARAIGSSQSRVAKMEAGDPSVSIDLLVRAVLALGAREEDVARIIEGAARTGV